MSVAPDIHPTAVIHDGAEIGPGCRIGPWCVVGPEARLGAGVVLDSHVVVTGDTHVGDDTRIWPFASIGTEPQDLKYRGEHTRVRIGARNRLREYVTINAGTEGGGGETRIGDDNLLMMHVHIAHDCRIGNGVIFANGVQVAGHVVVEDNAVIGAMAGLHQFIRVGRGAMVGAGSMVLRDVIPYGTVTPAATRLAGLNLVGLKRRGADKAHVNGLRAAYRSLFSQDVPLQEAARALAEEQPDNPLIRDVVAFVLARSDRAFCTPD